MHTSFNNGCVLSNMMPLLTMPKPLHSSVICCQVPLSWHVLLCVCQCTDPRIMQARKACQVCLQLPGSTCCLLVVQGPVVLAPGKPPCHMTMPTLSNLSSLTQLTELALSDVHNRLSLPGLQHLPCLSNLRSALLVLCDENTFWHPSNVKPSISSGCVGSAINMC